ncbi:sulfonate ABC transporter substrate-binding protein [Herbaspirillum sp. RTI4]|uniref:sulfonate ABC transporter substrate-binding protein n=1 Tax=Herbaspirillum sp. RTI4 TaxID=3048640 RepID=UPI002AB4D571|nr:sulfonate ABC transporter substrate-binding protein [Herbaspirillum sp. RTI4]MDY7579695.1 sulfonate ABC transporter substrate-binding protein [Herbaspirillum sp. RTI4]MEA9983022.1 sulfonate ABC transporter substrate-binding protein [Herbaspirillum sp. RTI4]
MKNKQFKRSPKRRTLSLLAGIAVAVIANALPATAQAETKVLRIGYQKAASTLVLLKAHGTLEKRLQAQGVEVKWAEFTAGPQLLEALNVGSIDFGYVGEAPPVFAQAAGADFVYTAYEIPTPEAEGLLVPKNSPIKSVAELKGKKIAFNKGSDVHWLVVALLKKAGLTYSDIQPVYLAPADARAAFERGAIDAWAIWDPFQAAAEKQIGARRLASGTGVVSHHQFFLSARPFAEKNQAVLTALLDEISKEGQWIRGHIKDAAAQLAPIQGLDADIIEVGLKRYAHIFRPIDDGVLDEQQRIADSFFELKLIPKKLNVKEAVLHR